MFAEPIEAFSASTFAPSLLHRLWSLLPPVRRRMVLAQAAA